MTEFDETDRIVVVQVEAPRIGAPIAIRKRLFAASALVAQAFTMAYVAPYRTTRAEVRDADKQGRDPNW